MKESIDEFKGLAILLGAACLLIYFLANSKRETQATD